MPYEPDKVQVFRRVEGRGEVLVSTNYYKRFERRVANEQLESFNAQGGAWYDNGGEHIPVADIPDWVWAECRAMDPGFRAFYRIVLPEEAEAGKRIPTIELAADWPTQRDIVEALMQLDPKDDTAWTVDGRPNLLALKRVLGIYVNREKLEAAAPTFVRPVINAEAD